jgi:hypothetical protein
MLRFSLVHPVILFDPVDKTGIKAGQLLTGMRLK